MKKVSALLVSTLSLFLLIQTAVAATIPVDFSRVQVNKQKQEKFTKEINEVFTSLPAQITSLKNSAAKSVVVLYPADITKVIGVEVWGAYIPNSGELLLNSAIYDRTDNAKSTIAHELLHSFVPAGNGYRYSGGSVNGALYEEMLVEYYSVEYYGGQTGAGFSGYQHLTGLIPKIKEVLSVAGATNPDAVLQEAIFTTKTLGSINTLVGPYLTNADFLGVLSRYLNTSESQSDIEAANIYLDNVIAKIKQKKAGETTVSEEIPQSETDSSSGDSKGTDLVTEVKGVSEVLSSGAGGEALTGTASGALIPPCLRDPEQSRTAGAECVTDSIVYYTNILLLVVAIAAFGYMLYGAFLYASAFGDEAKVNTGKKAITYAITGIIISGAAALLVELLRSALRA